jgi:hypothetical protein
MYTAQAGRLRLYEGERREGHKRDACAWTKGEGDEKKNFPQIAQIVVVIKYP